MRILPPADEAGVVVWRWCIAIAVLLLLANGFSGRGWVIPFGDFAYADDVAVQADKIDRILTLQIAASLRQLNAELCRANGNTGIIRATIEDYQQQMRELTGERYPLPECHEETT